MKATTLNKSNNNNLASLWLESNTNYAYGIWPVAKICYCNALVDLLP